MKTKWQRIGIVVFTFFILLFTTHCAGPQAFVSESDVGYASNALEEREADSLEVIAQDADTSSIQVRVLTYNIFHGGLFSTNIGHIAKVIQSVNPDIVAIQEIDKNRFITGYVDQVTKLGNLTGLVPIFGPEAQTLPTGKYGNAILTRFDIKGHTNHLLHSYLGVKQRRMLEVEMSVNDFHFYFFTAHFSPLDIPSRVLLAKTAKQIFLEKSDTPMILAGDFNAGPYSNVLSVFGDRFAVAGKNKNIKTYPSIIPISHIDHILFYPQDQWKVLQVKTISKPFISDHLPVLVVLEWAGPPSRKATEGQGPPSRKATEGQGNKNKIE